MVVSDSTIGAQVGRDMLAAGGNAIDAAVATALAMAVAYPTAGNLGGGGFMVARLDGKMHSLDFRETAPAAATREMYVGPDGKPNGASREGYKSAGVPGSVAGLFAAHKKLGTKTWREVIAPAIRLAEEGFVVDAELARSLKESENRFKKYPASMALFYANGAPPAPGSTFKNPDLAKVLKRIADKGPAGFYEGETAEAIAADMKENGGLITVADLKAYEAKWREPLTFSYRGQTVTSMPPPSSGGVTVAMIAHLVEGYDLSKLGFQSPEELHVVFESMRRAFAARNARLGDPDFVKNPLDELLSKQWADTQRASIAKDKATPSTELGAPSTSGGTGPHTTHFSVVDEKGNAVALTTTLNWWYGFGAVVKGAGFVLNNEMDDFASVPGTANGFGLVQSEPNVIAPGKRMLSSMAPTIVSAPDGRIVLITGGAGGPTIINSVFQIMSNTLDFGLSPVTAVNAPRFHLQHLPDVVMYEKNGLDPEKQKTLEAMGYSFKERGHIADSPTIGFANGVFVGAPEPRREGAAAFAR
jgi:gamma-glutamyltranspeptidase/glutathione hydrolase